MGLNNREYKELEKLKKKSGFTKLSVSEQRRLERLQGLLDNDKKQVAKDKWENDRSLKAQQLHIQTLNENQSKFLRSMRMNTITIGSGSSGTGKSYLACRYAASELLAGNIKKIVITRPYVAVSGRTTGFKPNTDIEKLRAFVLPMLGYLGEVLGEEYVENQLQMGGTIELAPLESIRGRNFDSAIIISDESSNMTIGEFQALSTRLGKDTRWFCIGDNAQCDTNNSGLKWFENLVDKHEIPSIGVVKFTHDDIVRSGMVKELVIAFEKDGGYKS
ncbi:PhoH-like protein [Acinetobacter phage Phab24]|nr:PhoH-like protein [Acinetobacter phage Phab24]